MTQVTASLIKELRDRTGVAMNKCKQALDEAQGDIEQAIQVLRKAGIAGAVKKEGRDTKDGAVGSARSNNAVALVEVNCETDFVARSDDFTKYLHTLSTVAAEKAIKDLEQLLQQPSEDAAISLEQRRALLIQKLGENIQVRRLTLMPLHGDNSVGVYSHANGQIVCAVEIQGSADAEALAREIAMHCAAEAPEYLQPSDVPESAIAVEREVAAEQVKNKPADIQAKIIEGKLNAFFDQNCLLRQKYLRDPSLTVAEYVAKVGKEHNQQLQLVSFIRWQIGR